MTWILHLQGKLNHPKFRNVDSLWSVQAYTKLAPTPHALPQNAPDSTTKLSMFGKRTCSPASSIQGIPTKNNNFISTLGESYAMWHHLHNDLQLAATNRTESEKIKSSGSFVWEEFYKLTCCCISSSIVWSRFISWRLILNEVKQAVSPLDPMI